MQAAMSTTMILISCQERFFTDPFLSVPIPAQTKAPPNESSNKVTPFKGALAEDGYLDFPDSALSVLVVLAGAPDCTLPATLPRFNFTRTRSEISTVKVVSLTAVILP